MEKLQAKKPYKAILLDLFWTTVDMDFSQLPAVEHRREGRVLEIKSTGGLLFQALQKVKKEISRPDFLEALHFADEAVRESWESGILEEVNNVEKFARFLAKLDLFSKEEDVILWDLARRFTEIHMTCVVGATVFHETRRQVLSRLAEKHDLVLVSNFDHAPAGYDILKNHQIEHFFKKIIISDEIGKRKPHPELFELAIQTLGVKPNEALMVGDSPLADIHGARQVGLDTAWIQRSGKTWPEDLEPPTFRLFEVCEILSLPRVRG